MIVLHRPIRMRRLELSTDRAESAIRLGGDPRKCIEHCFDARGDRRGTTPKPSPLTAHHRESLQNAVDTAGLAGILFRSAFLVVPVLGHVVLFDRIASTIVGGIEGHSIEVAVSSLQP